MQAHPVMAPRFQSKYLMSDFKKIAIVDDHLLFRKGLTSLIKYFVGYRVILEASNGREFIRQLNPADLPDVVLLDISMPEMDGYETAAWLQEHYPQVKILALSTMESESSIIRMVRQGAKGYILKDADPDELKRALDEVLRFGYFFNDLVTHRVLRALTGNVEAQEGSVEQLSEREKEFLRHACSELTYGQIADMMCVSPRTVEGYRNSLCEKLGLKTRTGLAIYAIKNGLVQL